jgi:hypothetical protein
MNEAMRRAHLLAAIVMLGGAMGCSDDDESDFCAALAESSCKWARGCCELAELSAVLDLDSDDAYAVELVRLAHNEQGKCTDLLHSSCVTQQRRLLESLRSERVALDRGRFDECLGALDSAASSCDIGLRTGPGIARACSFEEIFEGKATEGDACFHELDCSEGTFCWRAGSSNGPGICRALVAQDGACRDTAKCADDQVCKPVETRTSSCVQMDRQAEGGFCLDDELCAPGLFCDGSSLECKARGAGGAECNLPKHCLSGRCRIDARECEPPRTAGEPCDSDQQCVVDFWCNTAFASRLCSVPLERGEAGDRCSSQTPCKEGLRCVATYCQAPLPDGRRCSDSIQCAEGSYCNEDTDVCTSPRLASGEDCDESRDCLPDFYCDGTCQPRVAAGDDCTASDVCAVGTRCSIISRVCEPLLDEGDVCRSAEECAAGLVCEQFVGRCDQRLARDAPCDRSAACPADQYCQRGQSTRICEPLATVGEGESCQSSAVRCADGLFCGTGSVCRAKGDSGDPCRTASECKDGLYCYEASVCAATASAGETCSSSFFGDDPICGTDLACDYDVDAGYTCVALPGDGEPCLSDRCASGYYCNATDVCTARVAAGGACTDSDMCAEDLSCDPDTDTCTAGKGEGEECDGDDCREGLSCRTFSGACAARVAETKECTADDECAAGLECEIDSLCTALAKKGELCDNELPAPRACAATTNGASASRSMARSAPASSAWSTRSASAAAASITSAPVPA